MSNTNEFFEFVASDFEIEVEVDEQVVVNPDQEVVLRYGTELITLPYVEGASMAHYLSQLIDQGVDTSAVNVKYEGQYVSQSASPVPGGVYSLTKTLDAKG